MNEVKNEVKIIKASGKGGRPPKAIRKSRFIGVKCSHYQHMLIKAKAKMAGLSVSEYLCELGVNGKVGSPKKSLPAEVLQLTGTLNHLAANLNQVAKKRNGYDPLDALERARLEMDVIEIKQVVFLIKNYLQ